MLSKKLSKFEKEIENAIFGIKFLRRHLKIEILNTQNWKQEYKVFYRNETNNILKYVMLTPRRKEVQRNLLIYDNWENRLASVPSYLAEKALCRICKHYILKAREVANDKESKVLNELTESPIDFDTIFSYDDKNKNIKEANQNARKKLNEVVSKLSESQTVTTNNPYFYIDRILALLRPYKNLYIPIVKLEIPIKPKECFSIRYSVENLQKKSISSLKFLLFGILPISVPLELEKAVPNHIMILSPKGLLFQYAGVTGLEGTEIEKKYKDLSEFFDDDMIYFHIPLEHTGIIYQIQSKVAKDKGTSNGSDDVGSSRLCQITANKKKKGPIIEVDLSIGRDIFQRPPSLVQTLIFLMYISIFIPSIAFFAFKYHITPSLLMQTLILEVTILVSIGVYAMEKPFLPEYITIQVLIILALFIIQIYCLHRIG
ncbi:MAG: hypothetical protein PVF58_04170 [Candidatus Methanofastidiosia archaeon]|jgi:hypothetical protein